MDFLKKNIGVIAMILSAVGMIADHYANQAEIKKCVEDYQKKNG